MQGSLNNLSIFIFLDFLPAIFRYFTVNDDVTEKSIKIFSVHASASDSEVGWRDKNEETPLGIRSERNLPEGMCRVDKRRKLYLCISHRQVNNSMEKNDARKPFSRINLTKLNPFANEIKRNRKCNLHRKSAVRNFKFLISGKQLIVDLRRFPPGGHSNKLFKFNIQSPRLSRGEIRLMLEIIADPSSASDGWSKKLEVAGN